MASLRVLITAFSAFPGAPVNPTLAIARGVAGKHARRFARMGVELHTAVLPVAYGGAQARVVDLIARTRPDIVLHLGLAGRRKQLTFETRARNRLSLLTHDAQRRRAGRMLIEPGGPAALRSRAPVARSVEAIARAGADCAPSIDAGDYLCNVTLHAALRSNAPLAAFLHVPRPRRLRARRGRARGATLDRMVEGVAAAIFVMAVERRRQRTA